MSGEDKEAAVQGSPPNLSYLLPEQVAQLLKPINGKRVGTDGKGFSHVEAYDVRAHLTRVFGFGRWSTDVSSLELVFEHGDERAKDGKKWTAWTVCYRAVVNVTVHAPDGTFLARYEDGATGEAKNQPSRGDAHDLAMKTALSQALKRAAVNLGDQFGLSLYNKGSKDALVKGLVVPVDSAAAPTDVEAHITEPLAPEDTPAEDSRTRSAQPTAEPATLPDDSTAASIYARLLAGNDNQSITHQQFVGNLMKEATAAKCLAATVDTDAGPMMLKLVLQGALQGGVNAA